VRKVREMIECHNIGTFHHPSNNMLPGVKGVNSQLCYRDHNFKLGTFSKGYTLPLVPLVPLAAYYLLLYLYYSLYLYNISNRRELRERKKKEN
jgi:hypothetical protein